MPFILQSEPESVFPHGIFTPFATEDEAMRQAAWDMRDGGGLETEYVGLFHVDSKKFDAHLEYDKDIPASALIGAWNSGDVITPAVVPYKPSSKLKKVKTNKEMASAASRLQEQILEDLVRAQVDDLLELNAKIATDKFRGNFLKNAVPGNAYTVCTGGTATAGAIALAAATAKTVIGVASGSANQPSIVECAFSFDGVSASAVPVLVEWVSGTNATNPPGTASTTMTPKQTRGWPAQSSQSTAAYNWTTEPTVLEAYKKRFLTPNGGLLVIQQPMGREMTGIVTAATQFKFIGYRLTAPAIVNTHSDLEYEE
jgi:hypothetical protein